MNILHVYITYAKYIYLCSNIYELHFYSCYIWLKKIFLSLWRRKTSLWIYCPRIQRLFTFQSRTSLLEKIWEIQEKQKWRRKHRYQTYYYYFKVWTPGWSQGEWGASSGKKGSITSGEKGPLETSMPCWGPIEATGLASPLPSLPTQWPSRYMFVAMGNLYMLPLPSIREDSGLSSPLKLPQLSPWINPWLAFSFYSQTGIISLYDCVFKRDPGYNQNLHRDDREHAKGLGLHVNEEVTARGCCRVWTDPLCACLFTIEFSCTKLSCLPVPGRDDQAAVSVPRFCPVKLFIFVTVQSCESESVKSYPILCNPMAPLPWNSPVTGVGCHSLL